MDSCFTCSDNFNCKIKSGQNIVGCLDWKPINNLNTEFQTDICNDCKNKVKEICDTKMKSECLKPSKYIGYHRALKYKKG